MPIEITDKIKPGQEVWTGFPGQYLTAPEEPGEYTLVERVIEDSDGNLIHDSFEFVRQ